MRATCQIPDDKTTNRRVHQVLAKNRGINSPVLWLVLSMLLYIGLWLLYPHSMLPSDPWAYSTTAFKISEGRFLENLTSHPFNHRLGITFPTAVFYKLFGVDILTTNLWPLCMALLILVVVWKATDTARSKSMALILTISCIPLFRANVALFPDIAAAGFMALSCLILYRRETYAISARWWLFPAAAVMFLFFGFLAKASAYWVIPFWLIVGFQDGRRREWILWYRFYLPAFIVGLLVLSAYLIFCHLLWGNAFSRLAGIQELTGEHLWSLQNATFGHWLARITIDPLVMITEDYGPIFFMMILAFWVVPNRVRFWGLYSIICVLFFWFGSASLQSYEPLPLEWRMLLPALPGMIILSSYLWDGLYISSALGAPLSKKVVTTLLLIVTALPFAVYMGEWTSFDFPQKQVAKLIDTKTSAENHHQFLLITSEERSASFLSFYFGYHYPENLTVVAAKDLLNLSPTQYDQGFIYMNLDLSRQLRDLYGILNFDREIWSLRLKPIFRTEKHLLYFFKNPTEIIKTLTTEKQDRQQK